MVEPSTGTTVVFVLIVAVVVVAFVAATARADRVLNGKPLAGKVALGTAVWLGITAAASASGFLSKQSVPPPVMLFFVASMGVALWVALSHVGHRLASAVPIAGLVAIHGFRLPLELVLHEWHAQGVLPLQMTYSGRNFDIVTGVLAVVVGAWLWRAAPSAERARKVVFGFNVIGLALLVTVASIAVTSTPGPLRQFTNDPPVLLAMHFPYGWIVPFCVGAALTGHVVIFRWLRMQRDRGV
ncbi:MAG: hypothetical protein AAF721_15325 [Myxococcota bacterium]